MRIIIEGIGRLSGSLTLESFGQGNDDSITLTVPVDTDEGESSASIEVSISELSTAVNALTKLGGS